MSSTKSKLGSRKVLKLETGDVVSVVATNGSGVPCVWFNSEPKDEVGTGVRMRQAEVEEFFKMLKWAHRRRFRRALPEPRLHWEAPAPSKLMANVKRALGDKA